MPQLLAYPNPTDPLNGDAAALYLHKPDEYKQKIKGKILIIAFSVKRMKGQEVGCCPYFMRKGGTWWLNGHSMDF